MKGAGGAEELMSTNADPSNHSLSDPPSRRESRRSIRLQQRYSVSPESTTSRKFRCQNTVPYAVQGRGRSKVWVFCEKFINEKGQPKARCKLCGAILCHNGGSTRGILHHLRHQHGEATKDDILPAVRKGPRDAPSGIDIDDDDAWVRHVDDDDDETTSEKTKEGSTQEEERAKGGKLAEEDEGEYVAISGDEAPSYADEVYIREDGSYVTEDLEEYVDVVYVQDEGDMLIDDLGKHNANAHYSSCDLRSAPSNERRNVAVSPPHIAMPVNAPPLRFPPKRFWRRTRDTAAVHHPIAQPSHYDVPFETGELGMHSGVGRLTDDSVNMLPRDMKNLQEGSNVRRSVEDRPMDVDEHFGQVVTLSLKSLPEEQRARARVAILNCIAELTDGQSSQGSFREE